MEQIERQRRYKLHGAIISAGWPSLTAFAKDAGYSKGYVLAVVRGSLFPPPPLQKKLCRMLNLSIKDLRDLL